MTARSWLPMCTEVHVIILLKIMITLVVKLERSCLPLAAIAHFDFNDIGMHYVMTPTCELSGVRVIIQQPTRGTGFNHTVSTSGGCKEAAKVSRARL